MRDVARGEKLLGNRLVHCNGASENTRADVWDVGQLEDALNGAVFAKRAVE